MDTDRIFLTGASSGIGRALAAEWARRGADLGLAARRLDALETLAAELRAKHGTRVVVRELDVTDAAATDAAIRATADELGGLDRVVANAGIARARKVGSDGFDDDVATIRTNLIGAMATTESAVRWFRENGTAGHVVGISSVAAFRGMPGNAAYCASKAGLSTYLEAVRAEVGGIGIDVTVLSPGFIDTPLNDMLPSRPFLVSADKGASIIADLVERRVAHSSVPAWPWSAIGFAMRTTPDFVWSRIVS